MKWVNPTRLGTVLRFLLWVVGRFPDSFRWKKRCFAAEASAFGELGCLELSMNSAHEMGRNRGSRFDDLKDRALLMACPVHKED